MKLKLALLSLVFGLTLSAHAQQLQTSGSYTATVLPADLALSPPSGALPGTLKIGLKYSATVAISGGTAPYTAVLSSGALPAGLTLAVSGSSFVITGTPTALCSPAPCAFVVMVTDSSPVIKAAAFAPKGSSIK